MRSLCDLVADITWVPCQEMSDSKLFAQIRYVISIYLSYLGSGPTYTELFSEKPSLNFLRFDSRILYAMIARRFLDFIIFHNVTVLCY